MVVSVRVAAKAALIVSSVAFPLNTDNFEPQCQSDKDYGWPRFNSLEELQASPWKTYFVKVYGELPGKFPVCVHDLWALNEAAYKEANITGHEVVPANEAKEGDLFSGGLLGYMIYHATWTPLPHDTWVEVAHSAFPTEQEGFWVWRLRGSGVWYNTGRTIVFPTPANKNQIHQEAIQFLSANCSKKPSMSWPQLESDIFGFCAREKGFDSLQFEPTTNATRIGSFGLVGLTEMVLVNIDGKYNCGVEDARKTPLRAGWLASRQCGCENYPIDESCGVIPRAPFPYWLIGAKPPICKIQAQNRFKKCNPNTCKPTTCTGGSTGNSLAVDVSSPVAARAAMHASADGALHTFTV